MTEEQQKRELIRKYKEKEEAEIRGHFARVERETEECFQEMKKIFPTIVRDGAKMSVFGHDFVNGSATGTDIRTGEDVTSWGMKPLDSKFPGFWISSEKSMGAFLTRVETDEFTRQEIIKILSKPDLRSRWQKFLAWLWA